MKFNETMLACKLTIESKAVPLIVGHAGIGKTTLAKKIAKKHDAHFISIDANLLKEGEIGGLPVVEDGKKGKKTVYAMHNKFSEIEMVLEENPEKEIILFIDELNRCEHAVQQELMNIVLNREINGYNLSDKVKVIAAVNPSDKYDEYSDSDYQVTEMDAAQEDRFVWLNMDADLAEWIDWGISLEKTGKDEEKISNIHSDILEFLADKKEFFLVLNPNEMIKATPRSWERVSEIYRKWLISQDEYSFNILNQVIAGNVGVYIAAEFIKFIRNKALLLTPEEILANNPLRPEIVEKIKQYSHYRLYILSKNTLNYMTIHLPKSGKARMAKIEIFVEYMEYLPEDMKMAVMKMIVEDYKEQFYKEFMKTTKFVNLYYKIINLIK